MNSPCPCCGQPLNRVPVPCIYITGNSGHADGRKRYSAFCWGQPTNQLGFLLVSIGNSPAFVADKNSVEFLNEPERTKPDVVVPPLPI
jgi:hypothetical protein